MNTHQARKARIADAIVRTYKLTWRDVDCDRDIDLHLRIDRLVAAYDDVTAEETRAVCVCCYGDGHDGPCCPGWFHGITDRGDQVTACDECQIARGNVPDDDIAQREHDAVCSCMLNERTRVRLSARPSAAPTMINKREGVL